MTKYETIKKLCKQQGKSVAQMERDLGFARGSISKIDDHKPSMDKVFRICEYLDVESSYIFSDAVREELKDRLAHKTISGCYEVAAGQGRINDGYEVNEVSEEEGSYARVVGDSMYPSLHDGDVVMFVETAEVDPSDYALVRIDGDEITVKHCEITDDGLWVRGENADAFTDRFFTMSECLTLPVQIIGKAVEIVSRKL